VEVVLQLVRHGQQDVLEVGGLDVGAEEAEHEPVAEGELLLGSIL
jgi:hypothetical protein